MNKTNSVNGANSSEIIDFGINTEDSEKRNRATKNWKKVKEISKKEDKRPPWQMVSLSTLPKADTNSILRAKLLDASRRLRAGKSSASTQTDVDVITTKLMKEVNTDVQYDLVSKKDAESLTDGTISMRQEGPGEFVFTHTVAQMTEGIVCVNMCTQTATPRISSIFIDQRKSVKFNEKEFQIFLNENEEILLSQSKNIKAIDKMLDKVNSSIYPHNIFQNTNNKKQTTVSRNPIDRKSKSGLTPTISFWSYDIIGEDIAYKTDNKDNCLSLTNNMAVGKKLANMTLAPTTYKKQNSRYTNSMVWNSNQYNAVFSLLREANAMVGIFEDISSFLGPDIVLNKLPTRDTTQVKFLSKYWNPILEDLQENIEIKTASLINPDIKIAHKIDLDIFF